MDILDKQGLSVYDLELKKYIKGKSFITLTIDEYNKRLDSYNLDNSYIDPDSNLLFKDTLYSITNDYIQLLYGAENATYKDTYALGATNLQDIVDIIANKITNELATKNEVEELKKSVSDGKNIVANAITDKGIPTDGKAAFGTMATNIKNIQTGTDTSDATATSEDISIGKTAYVAGRKITGTLENVDPSGIGYLDDYHGGNLYFMRDIGKSQYIIKNGNSIQTEVPQNNLTSFLNLTGEKIVSGNTILGVQGRAIETHCYHLTLANANIYAYTEYYPWVGVLGNRLKNVSVQISGYKNGIFSNFYNINTIEPQIISIGDSIGVNIYIPASGANISEISVESLSDSTIDLDLIIITSNDLSYITQYESSSLSSQLTLAASL